MKTPTESQQPGQPGQPATRLHLQKRRGVALILVISFIVLLSALVIGFFSRVSTELSSARSYAEGVNVRQLADSRDDLRAEHGEILDLMLRADASRHCRATIEARVEQRTQSLFVLILSAIILNSIFPM